MTSKQNICPTCKENFKDSLALRKHFNKEHRKSGKFYCISCGIPLGSLSNVRAHQWKVHREMFTNALKAVRSKKAAIKRKASKELISARGITNGVAQATHVVVKKEMTAFELLQKFQKQRDFMVDVVNLIEGMLNQ